MAYDELGVRHSSGSPIPQPRGLALRRPRPTSGPIWPPAVAEAPPRPESRGFWGTSWCGLKHSHSPGARESGMLLTGVKNVFQKSQNLPYLSRIYQKWKLCFVGARRHGTSGQCGARSGSAPRGSDPWRAFSAQILRVGGTLGLAFESCAHPGGETVWGLQ